MSAAQLTPNEFRDELKKILPGYSWTVHRPLGRIEFDGLPPQLLTATGIQSSGSNRLSTLEVTRRVDRDQAIYTARSAGYGRRARWLHAHTDDTLARALRGLQEHYKHTADTYRSHEKALEKGRAAIARPDSQGAAS